MQRALGVKRILAAAAALGALASVGGCALVQDKPAEPAWFKARAKALKKEAYPKLAAVPEPIPPSRTFAEWSRLQGDVEGAGEALEANPRARPAADAPQAANEFEAQARKAAQPARPER